MYNIINTPKFKLDISTIRNGQRYLIDSGQGEKTIVKIFHCEKGSSLIDFISVDKENGEIPLVMRLGHFKKNFIRKV